MVTMRERARRKWRVRQRGWWMHNNTKQYSWNTHKQLLFSCEKRDFPGYFLLCDFLLLRPPILRSLLLHCTRLSGICYPGLVLVFSSTSTVSKHHDHCQYRPSSEYNNISTKQHHHSSLNKKIPPKVMNILGGTQKEYDESMTQ